MEDLRIELLHNRNYILLVDDANRQLDVFKQIMGVFKEHRKGKIKLLLTVRDYALKGLSDEFSDYAQKHVELNKFTDEEING
ncbi:hypothetical protein NK918_24895, partial [Salmonella enterica subsp. enterica serovar Typhimurium]|uniref:hypothetical protein n=1 Tax=Salmonella enterica TaxID=28901 RepID=UPI0020A2A4DB